MQEPKKQLALGLLAYAVQRDLPADRLCELAEIDYPALLTSDTTVSDIQIGRLWKHASTLTDDPYFGLHFGESLQLAALGIVGEIIKSSDTVGEGIKTAVSLTPGITDVVRTALEVAEDSFTISLITIQTTDESSAFLSRQIAEMLMVFAVHELDGLVLEKICPLSVTLPYPVSEIKEYLRVLRCTNYKQAPNYSLTFDRKYWDLPLLSANHEMQAFLLKQVMETESQTPEGLSARIYQFLKAHPYLGMPTLDEVASNFNTTPRTLQRKLKQEGKSFQEITNEIRKSLAIDYVVSDKYQIKEIAHLLGYNEVSAFSRAFKRWTGKAPIEY
ncbi:transcriptional regulator, AraC family [Fulvivirga imtechensis AK7]|uniref:Transcriptional regulator, AraC family n=1 Tax=Fulvivirga imtechensis AK7 TaxID=1237149 RepID=L8JV83_9BACT|nr:AraC family transcriptional regulator [Fulvivirga imtechensis]ELR71162.1 transcriptional regulator, AraC family [Fulvivirga imtechensis AK7]